MSCRPGPAVGALVVQALVAILLLPLAVVCAQAQGGCSASTTSIAITRATAALAREPSSAGHDTAAEERSSRLGSTPLTYRVVTPIEPARPSLLVPLYVTFGTLQALDAHSTMRALENGAREANPMVAPFGENPAALVAMKAATTAGTIVLAERLRRKHPVKAMVMMTAVNVAYAAIVAANYRR